MKRLLQNTEFLILFGAQVSSLLAIGVMTVSLSLTAYDFGGVAFGGLVFGGILALKMVAYVGVAPLAEAVLGRAPRRAVLIGLGLLRGAVVAAIVMSPNVWWVMGLAFLVFAASAGFTPLVQATIPDLLPDEADYTRALAVSRIAYTVEAVASPLIAGLLLGLVAPQSLFVVPAILFLLSASLIVWLRLPALAAPPRAPFFDRLVRGARIYVRTPRLRGLWLVQFGLTAPLAWVLVNSVIYAGTHGRAAELYPQLMMAYGIGTAAGALLVPRLVARVAERTIMVGGALGFGAVGLLIWLAPLPPAAFAVWAGLGAAASLVLTPGGVVLARSAAPRDRPALFAAQFALSHAGWLIAYPLAGIAGAVLGPEVAMAALSALCIMVAWAALLVWPAEDRAAVPHTHPDLPPGHPHLLAHADGTHRHPYFIDDLHPHWPTMRGV
ncbi:MAG: MFS transporter [Pseudomonadota bacterium]